MPINEDHVLPSQKVPAKNRLIQASLLLCVAFIIVDFAYKQYNNISYLNRSSCVLNKHLPKLAFLLFEYIVEFSIVIFVGIFVAVLLEKYFLKYKSYIPQNPITAFLYASVIPLCSCAAIPLVATLRGRLKLRTLLTFLIAAPLLNPYIVVISFSVLGFQYGVLRIMASFVLATTAGYTVEYFMAKTADRSFPLRACMSNDCTVDNGNIYQKTVAIFLKIVPYVIVGGLIAVGLDIFSSRSLKWIQTINSLPFSDLIVILIGIPFYFCNGADVLLLKPLTCSGISIGAALAFSLTSTSICITSILMLVQFMGRRATLVLLLHLVCTTYLIGMMVHLFI